MQFLVPVRQEESKKAGLAWGTPHAPEAADEAWLCSWHSVAPRRDGATWGESRKPIPLGRKVAAANQVGTYREEEGNTSAEGISHF